MAVRVSVARGGSGSGVLTAGKERAELVVVGGDAYVKAGRGFWAAYGGKATNASDLAGHWTRVPGTGLDFDLKVLAGPATLGPRLKAGDEEKGTETVQGKQVRRITTPQGDYLVAAEAPYKVVSYVGRSGRFDLTELPDTQGLYDEIKGRVRALGGAREAGVRFVPGKLVFGNCNDNVAGCKLDLPATKVTQGDDTNQTLAAMTATITAEGRTLGTCQDVRPVGTARRIVLSCTVRGKGWKSWMRQARETPGAHPYEAKALVVAQAVTPADVTALLAGLGRESRGG